MARRKKTPLDDIDLQERVRKNIQQARTNTSNWRVEARECYDLRDGHQWPEEDLAMLREQMRPITTFNRIGPVIDAVCGSEVLNRQEVNFIPRSSEDDGVSALATGAVSWARDNCDAEDEESDAFLDMVTCGMGWTETRMDYEEDPEGMVRVERVDPLEMFWDPAAKKKNLTDASWLARSRFWSKEDILAHWPDAGDLLEANDPYGDIERESDQSSPHLADKQDPYSGEQNDEIYKNKGKYRVIEYQWVDRETVYRMEDPTQEKVITLTAEQHDKLAKAAKKADMAFDAVKQTRKIYKRAFFLGAQLLEEGDNPSPNSFTYKCMCGKRDRNTNTWYGLVRPMKDPQQWANKWLSQALHIFNSQAKGGILAEEDAFADVRKAEQTWARPDAITTVAPGALEKKKIQPKPVAEYPASMDKLMNFAVSSIRDVTGVNLELLGLADRQQAGVVETQRKQAGLTILASLFDALRRYRKEQGRLLLGFIRDYISDGRLIRIVGQDGTAQFVPLLKDMTSGEYDIVVDDAPSSPNQKEQTWAILQQLLPAMVDIIPPKLWPEIIKQSPLPYSFSMKAQQIINEQLSQPPAPDPKMELEKVKGQYEIQSKQMDTQIKQLELQIKQVEAAAKVEEIHLTAQTDQIKTKQEMDIAQLKALVEHQKAQNDMAVNNAKTENAMLQAQVKADAEERKAKAQAEAETAKTTQASQGQMMTQMVQVLAKGLEAMGEKIGSAIVEAMSAERVIVEDAKGRPIGVRSKMMRAVN